MKEKISPLNPEEIEVLQGEFETLTFANDFDLVYENQIPCAGIALIEGEIHLMKKSKVDQVISKAHILCINQLLSEEPLQYGCRVRAKSKIILLGKSDILNFVQDKKSRLFPLLSRRA